MAVIINSGWTVAGNWYAAGYNYNQLNAWGLNSYGQLGTSNQINYSSPVQVGTSQLWTNIALGLSHSIALQSPGTLWSWGSNSQGQLGVNTSLGYQPNSPVPVQAPNVPLVAQWASLGQQPTGSYGSGIQPNGTLWTWGLNSNGQLGLNTTVGVSSPVQVGALSAWTQVAGGSNFQLALQSPGTLWAWGAGALGQLGQSNTTNYSSPVQVGALSAWTQISAGAIHSTAIQSPGTLWSWGYGGFGQLGNNDTSNQSSPIQVFVSATGVWKTIGKTFGSFQIAIQSNGTLWTWGLNSNGQLGLNTTVGVSSPVQVGALSTWTQVAGGSINAAAIQSNGTLWMWGSNSYGQLGLNTTRNYNYSSPVQVGALSAWTQVTGGVNFQLALQSPGTLWAWGADGYGQLGLGNQTNYSSPVQVGALTTWTQISCGYAHSIAVQSNGTLWAWGYGGNGQLGLSDTTNRSSPVQVGALSTWTQVACGYYYTIALQSNGTLWAWGANDYGLLGLNTTTNYSSPVQIGALSTWTQVASGYIAVAAIQSPGTLWAWGYGGNGQLGLSDTTNRSSPVQVGTLSTWYQVAMQRCNIGAILQSSGTLYASGLNSFGSLGNNSTTSQSSPVTILSPGSGSWNKISSASSYTMAIQSNGTLWGVGINGFGQLGLNTTAGCSLLAQVGALSTWTQISCGYAHSLSIQSPGTLWTWGLNSNGQLGLNTTTNYSSPVQIGASSTWTQVACGYYHSMAVQRNGTLWSWGSNSSGQLGVGSAGTNILSPVQVGALSVWTKISGGYYTSTTIQSNGTLWSWGTNSFGQLGLNTNTNYSSPVQILSPFQGTWIQVAANGQGKSSAAIISPGTLWAWGFNNVGQLGNNSTTTQSSPVQIGALSTWTSVSCGYYAMAIQTPGTLWAWGFNPYGNLGNNTTMGTSSPVQIGALSTWTQVSAGTVYNTLAIQTPGSLWAWGLNSYGQLGTSNTTNYSSPVQIGTLNTWSLFASGSSHSVAIQSNGTLWSWGNNSFGQLGLNTSTLTSVLSPVQVGALSTWTQVRGSNSNYTLALQSNGTLWGWGNNTYGVLGLNTTTNYSSPVQIGALSTWTQVACGYLNSAGIYYT
jgi:alpha-tubulin suppressor-like RCC1 family protein